MSERTNNFIPAAVKLPDAPEIEQTTTDLFSNVTTLRTVPNKNAQRGRRYRGHKPNAAPSPVLLPAPIAPQHRAIRFAALVTAIALAGVSAFFGVTGMTAIFAAAVIPVMIMTGVLELAKLVTVGWLTRHRNASWALRAPLLVMVALLMLLTAGGTFGFLSRAHLDRQAMATAAINYDAAPIEQRITLAESALHDVDGRIAQLDAIVAASTQRGRTLGAMALIGDQSAPRAALVTQRERAAQTLGELKLQQAGIERARLRVANENGPAMFLARLFGSTDSEAAVRLITALLVLVLDPLAVLLTIAAVRRS